MYNIYNIYIYMYNRYMVFKRKNNIHVNIFHPKASSVKLNPLRFTSLSLSLSLSLYIYIALCVIVAGLLVSRGC